MSSKAYLRFSLFCVKLELFAKIKKNPSFYTFTKTRFINNSRSKQNKKNPKHPFVDIGKTETCAKFQQKILNSMVVGACQSFPFFRQITWFIGNKITLSNVSIGFCIS